MLFPIKNYYQILYTSFKLIPIKCSVNWFQRPQITVLKKSLTSRSKTREHSLIHTFMFGSTSFRLYILLMVKYWWWWLMSESSQFKNIFLHIFDTHIMRAKRKELEQVNVCGWVYEHSLFIFKHFFFPKMKKIFIVVLLLIAN